METRIEITLNDPKLQKRDLISVASDLCSFYELQPLHRNELINSLEKKKKKGIVKALIKEFQGVNFIVL